MNTMKFGTLFHKYSGWIIKDTLDGGYIFHNCNDLGLICEDEDLVMGKVDRIIKRGDLRIVEFEPFDIGKDFYDNYVDTKEQAINEIENCYKDTASQYAYYTLEDDETENGGTSFKGETLRDFLFSVNVSLDTDMDEVNEILINNGIKPIK